MRGVFNIINIKSHLMKESEVLCLSETWMRGDEAKNTPWITECILGPIERTGEARGGATIKVSLRVPYQHKAKYKIENMQFTAIKIGEVTIVAIQILPSIKIKDTQHLLAMLKVLDNRRLIIGDFNGRYKRWDERNNTTGLALMRQARKHGYNFNVPTTSPCFTRNGKQLYRSCINTQCKNCPITDKRVWNTQQ